MKRNRVRETAAAYRPARPEAAARRRPVNLSLDAAVVAEARAAGLNLSRTVEALLAEELRRRRWAAWREENKAAIEAYNRHIARDGIAGEEFRPF
jgi:antitoxin CcdA